MAASQDDVAQLPADAVLKAFGAAPAGLVHGSAAILRTPAESMRDLADDLARCLAAVPKSRASSQPRSLDLANYSSESAHGMGA